MQEPESGGCCSRQLRLSSRLGSALLLLCTIFTQQADLILALNYLMASSRTNLAWQAKRSGDRSSPASIMIGAGGQPTNRSPGPLFRCTDNKCHAMHDRVDDGLPSGAARQSAINVNANRSTCCKTLNLQLALCTCCSLQLRARATFGIVLDT